MIVKIIPWPPPSGSAKPRKINVNSGCPYGHQGKTCGSLPEPLRTDLYTVADCGTIYSTVYWIVAHCLYYGRAVPISLRGGGGRCRSSVTFIFSFLFSRESRIIIWRQIASYEPKTLSDELRRLALKGGKLFTFTYSVWDCDYPTHCPDGQRFIHVQFTRHRASYAIRTTRPFELGKKKREEDWRTCPELSTNEVSEVNKPGWYK